LFFLVLYWCKGALLMLIVCIFHSIFCWNWSRSKRDCGEMR
jgi:hypothetical protein